MKTYPIMLDVRGRLAVVVGAGAVGLRKAEALCEAGAAVRLVDSAPGQAPEGVEVCREPYRPGHLAGASLVFACTDSPELNERIARDAHAIGAMVNLADAPEQCDFRVPSILRDDEVVVAVSSGGAVPGLSAWLRRRLAEHMPERVGELAKLLDELRAELRAELPDDPARRMWVMKHLISDDTHRDFLAAGAPAVRDRLRRLVEAAKDIQCPPQKPNC